MNKTAIYVCACCGAILYSKHQHDFVQCECENLAFVDGMGERHGAKDLKAIKPCLTMAEARRLSAAYMIKPTKPRSTAITMNVSVTKKKRKSQPPAFITLIQAWKDSGHSQHLRFGQWFIGQFMPTDHGDSIDFIWNTQDVSGAMAHIFQFYQKYQWEMV